MAITITGENVLIEADKYDMLCDRASQAARYEKVIMLVGEVLNFTGWEDEADDDAKDSFRRMREAWEDL